MNDAATFDPAIAVAASAIVVTIAIDVVIRSSRFRVLDITIAEPLIDRRDRRCSSYARDAFTGSTPPQTTAQADDRCYK
jgi:hypothetical protein